MLALHNIYMKDGTGCETQPWNTSENIVNKSVEIRVEVEELLEDGEEVIKNMELKLKEKENEIKKLKAQNSVLSDSFTNLQAEFKQSLSRSW